MTLGARLMAANCFGYQGVNRLWRFFDGAIATIRLMAHDRARRDLASRPINTQILKMKAWPEAKPAFTSDAGTGLH